MVHWGLLAKKRKILCVCWVGGGGGEGQMRDEQNGADTHNIRETDVTNSAHVSCNWLHQYNY